MLEQWSSQRIYTSPLEFLQLCGEAIPKSKSVAWNVKKIHHFGVLNRNIWAFGIWIKSCSLGNGVSAPRNYCNGSSKATDGRTCSKRPSGHRDLLGQGRAFSPGDEKPMGCSGNGIL